MRLELQPVDMGEVITNAVEAVQPAASSKGIAVATAIDGTVGFVDGDQQRLQQIVGNLLSNAIKFTLRGGNVTVTLMARGDQLELSVSDTGQGIEAEFLPRIFDRFQQQDPTTARRHGGLGSGLSIAKELAHAHGGDVQATSGGAGQGATFTLRLPMSMPVADAGAAPPRRAAALPEPRVRLGGTSILVVDDDADIREVAAAGLRAAGAEVRVAESAVEALEQLRQQPPDVLISHIGMPDNDGYDLLRWVRSLPAEEGSSTRAIAFTACAASEDARRALSAGYEAHLVKPIEPHRLVDAVEALLSSPG